LLKEYPYIEQTLGDSLTRIPDIGPLLKSLRPALSKELFSNVLMIILGEMGRVKSQVRPVASRSQKS
jgi:hypothetical protein